jgi:hypothetical protein
MKYAILAILLAFILVLGCLGTKKEEVNATEKIGGENVGNITEGIENINEINESEIPEINLPEINESEGEFPLPV